LEKQGRAAGLIVFATLAGAALVGCAESPAPSPAAAATVPALAETDTAPSVAHQTEPTEPAALPRASVASCEARRGTDGLRRTAVLRTLDGGLGHWLQNVDVDPKLDHGRFRGWIIRTLPAEDACYADLDLRAGDVITRVNGRPVERPEEASDVWDGLRTSSALVIDFTRAGQPHTLRFKIVDAP
jgi:S1-C subfamily serine protease